MRTDICITILATRFQDFDHGKAIWQLVPIRFNLQKGETVAWECAQFSGHCKVIERDKDVETGVDSTMFCLEKVS